MTADPTPDIAALQLLASDLRRTVVALDREVGRLVDAMDRAGDALRADPRPRPNVQTPAAGPATNLRERS